MPYSGAIAFIGRDEDLENLHQQLQQTDRVAITAIAGMGGIGKTELALQYAMRHLETDTYSSVFWLRSRENIGIQITQFGRSYLDLPIPTDRDLPEQVQWCWQHWPSGAVLLVFDDVQHYDDIKPWLPPAGASCFKLLLTTRQSRLGGAVRNYEIQVLSEDAALRLLGVICEGKRDLQLFQGGGDFSTPSDTAKQICQWLGYLPLGIELVGRYLARKPDCSLEALWQRLQQQKLAAKALLAQDPGMTATHEGVAAAFELSWQDLAQEAQELATWLSLFAPTAIPWDLVQACLSDWDEETLEDLRDEFLCNRSLLTRTDEAMYNLHPLLREFFAAKREQRTDTDAMKRTFCAVMVAIADQMPSTHTLTTLEQFAPAILHLQEAVISLELLLSGQDVIWLALGIARFYEAKFDVSTAEAWYQRCCEITECRLGPDHPNTAGSLATLASLHYIMGRYNEAESLLARSLAIREQQLGADHPDTAHSLNNLAALYQAMERYGDAEPLLVDSVAIYKRKLGSNHLAVAASLNNLAALYRSIERYKAAEPLYKRSLAIREQQLGVNHPDTAVSLNNLALLYYSTGRYSEAEPLYKQSLAIREQQLGVDHPSTAISLNNLALLYYSTGRYSDAEPLFIQALAILVERLGGNHPNTRNFSRNFYGCLQGAIAANQQHLLSNHPLTQNLLRAIERTSSGAPDA